MSLFSELALVTLEVRKLSFEPKPTIHATGRAGVRLCDSWLQFWSSTALHKPASESAFLREVPPGRIHFHPAELSAHPRALLFSLFIPHRYSTGLLKAPPKERLP
jgi:hypothetical protein